MRYFVSDPLLETQQHVGAQEGHVHIRIQQRNGRKTLTTVQGLSEDYDKKKIVRVCKKVRDIRDFHGNRASSYRSLDKSRETAMILSSEDF